MSKIKKKKTVCMHGFLAHLAEGRESLYSSVKMRVKVFKSKL